MKYLSLFLFVLLISTNIQAQISSDYDMATDFSVIKTYTFAGWEKNSDQILNDFDKDRITKALRSEFNSRGMSYVESDGNVEITLYIVINKKTSTTAYTTYTGGMGYYGGRRGWGRGYGGVGMSSGSTSYSESDYLEGTLVINMFDKSSKDLMWEGIITTVVKEKPEKREKSIPKKIKKLMKKYPVKPTK